LGWNEKCGIAGLLTENNVRLEPILDLDARETK